MFQQRPMPPMNPRGYFRPQQMPMGYQPMQTPFMGRAPHVGSQMGTRGAGGLKGLLSKIIPGAQGGAGAITPHSFIGGAHPTTNATRGALQGLMNPSNISGMLGNVQRVLGMAQQVTPMVQQYGPLVKNLPAMIKIYRELNSASESDTEQTTSNEESDSTKAREKSTATPKPKIYKNSSKLNSAIDDNITHSAPKAKKTQKRKPSTKSSQPKMYI